MDMLGQSYTKGIKNTLNNPKKRLSRVKLSNYFEKFIEF